MITHKAYQYMPKGWSCIITNKEAQARVAHNVASSGVMGRPAWAACRGAVMCPTKADRPEKGVAVSI